jgi:hypothetical protein
MNCDIYANLQWQFSEFRKIIVLKYTFYENDVIF